MYNELTSAEGKYLLYIIDSISDLENKINEALKDRDFKLKLVLYDEYSDFKDNINLGINEVKKMINQLDLKNLDAKHLESISLRLNDVIYLLLMDPSTYSEKKTNRQIMHR